MASFPKKNFLLFLLTLLSSSQIHARDPQLFNKIPSNNGAKETQVVVPNSEEQEPNFTPENVNGGYGLYGHESGQLPPSTTTTTTNPNSEPYKANTNLPYNSDPKETYPKYLPKNYNTEAYVTEPEGYRPENNNNNNNKFYNGENTYYNNEAYVTEPEGYKPENNNYNEQKGLGETKLLGSSYTNPSNNRNNYYNNNNNNNNYGASKSYYNGEQQGLSDTRFNNYNKNKYYNYNGGNTNGGVQKKGMSDTRFLENGKYFYDISTEQNFNRGPYGANNRGYYGNNNDQNSYNNYQDQEQFQNFQDEEDLP